MTDQELSDQTVPVEVISDHDHAIPDQGIVFEQMVSSVPADKYKRSCCAPMCDSGTVSRTDEVSFHRFPYDESKRIEWIACFPDIEWKFTKSGRLCSKHFLK